MESYLIEPSSPVVPIDLQWIDLNYSIGTKNGEKNILKGISGHALHNELLVLMGSSGAGKTTLLNILSNRIKQNSSAKLSGKVLANCQSIFDIQFSNYIGYVTQEDILIDTMTVYECLMFVANLKTNYLHKKSKVLEVIHTLKLEKCKDSLIGGVFVKGISGGEKKRTSIGMELITNPSVIFLDEPTSGLDSYTALLVVKLLLSQASLGKTIISTIHQPSSDIFYLFDKLLLMCDGKVVYQGTARESIRHFEQAGLVCPSLSNPADFYMEVLYIKNTNQLTIEEQNLVEKLSSIYKQTKLPEISTKVPLESSSKLYSKGSVYQLVILLQRCFLRILRNPVLSIVRIGMIMTIALMVLIFYWDMPTSGYNSVVNRNGLIFFSLSCGMFCNVLACVLTLPKMRSVFLKEYHSNMYGIVPYFLSFNIIDLIWDLLSSSLYVSIIYWAVGLNTNNNTAAFEYYVLTYLIYLSGGSIGILCGSLTGRPDIALAAGSGILFPFMYFSGFYRGGDLPESFSWVKYTSLFYYSFQGSMKSQYTDLEIRNCEVCVTPFDCVPCDPLASFNITLSVSESIYMQVIIIILLRMIGMGGLYLMAKTNKS